MMSAAMNGVRLCAIGVVLSGALCVPPATYAQVPAVTAQAPGVVIGVVTDAQGKPQLLPGVTITIETRAGVRSAVTDRQGRYRIAGLPLGAHRVVADLPGFLLTAKEVALSERYPEAEASLVMYVGPLDETSIIPRPTPRYRVWPLGPEAR